MIIMNIKYEEKENTDKRFLTVHKTFLNENYIGDVYLENLDNKQHFTFYSEDKRYSKFMVGNNCYFTLSELEDDLIKFTFNFKK